MIALLPSVLPSAGSAAAPAARDDGNVVFATPSPDASGAVPIGDGEVGASVWIEPGGDQVLDLARSDSFSEACRIPLERRRNSHPAGRFPATRGPNFDWLPDQTHGGNLLEIADLLPMQCEGRRILLLPAGPPGRDVSSRLPAPGPTVVEGRVAGGEPRGLVVEPASLRADIEAGAAFAKRRGPPDPPR